MTLGVYTAYEFTKSGPLHLVTVAVCAGSMLALCLGGRRLGNGPGERRLRRGWVGFLALSHLVGFASALRPDVYDPRWSLPLHLCHWAVIPTCLALWSELRWARTLAYYWALGLSSQAFFTPVLDVGPESIFFWTFWANHLSLVGGACYVVWVRGYRPETRDTGFAFAATVGYAAVILPVDLVTGWNYGFLGPQDLPGTLFELMPRWPWRLPCVFLLVALGFSVMQAIWPWSARMRRALQKPPARG